MSPVRRCSRTGCSLSAIATLTYVYADSTAVVGPLAAYAEPHGYDLCGAHAQKLTAPRGWEVVRYQPDLPGGPARSSDDLEALADAVREAARPVSSFPGAPRSGEARNTPPPGTSVRRGHLRAVPTP